MDINEKMVEKAAHELEKYAYYHALKEHDLARGIEGTPDRPRSYASLPELKAAVKAGRLKPGETVEGEAFLCPYISLHHPRAHYPEMVLGELRAASETGGEGLQNGADGVSWLPHMLPVVRLPGLPGGWGIHFLYPQAEGLFQRYEHPHRLMDLLTRDYLRLPLLLPVSEAGAEGPAAVLTGWVRFRARLLEMKQGQLEDYVRLDRRESEAYAVRGLNLFLAAVGEGDGVEPLDPAAPASGGGPASCAAPCGSLFVETRIRQLPESRVEEVLEEALSGMAEEIFPGTERGERRDGLDIDHSTGHHFLRFRRRLFALIYRPVIAVYRSPHFLSLYLPTTLDPAALAERERLFERAFAFLEERMTHHASAVEGGLPVDFTHDPCQPGWRVREALRNGLIDRVAEERPHLAKTVLWLRGAELD